MIVELSEDEVRHILDSWARLKFPLIGESRKVEIRQQFPYDGSLAVKIEVPDLLPLAVGLS